MQSFWSCWRKRLLGQTWHAHAVGEGCPRQLVKSKVAERGDGKGVRWNEMLDAGGRKEVVREGCEREVVLCRG